MRTLIVRLGTMSDARARFVTAGRKALEGSAEPVTPSINFASYDDMHRVLAPSIGSPAGQIVRNPGRMAQKIGERFEAIYAGLINLRC